MQSTMRPEYVRLMAGLRRMVRELGGLRPEDQEVCLLAAMQVDPKGFGLRLRGNETALEVWEQVGRIIDGQAADERRRLILRSVPCVN